jgi:hypothetical protein
MARAVGPTIEVAAANKVVALLERELVAGGRKIKNAAVGALKRTLSSGKTAASRDIRDKIRLGKKAVDRRILTRVISERSLVGKMAVRDRRIQLIEFITGRQQVAQLARQRKQARGQGRAVKGVRVKVRKDQPARVYPGTFIALGRKTGKPYVLKREGRPRYPIFIQYGPNLIDDFIKTFGAFAGRVTEQLNKNMQNVLDRFARGDLRG